MDYVVIHELATPQIYESFESILERSGEVYAGLQRAEETAVKICYKALIFIEIHGFCRFSLFSSISCWIFQSVDCIIVPMMIYGLLIILII